MKVHMRLSEAFSRYWQRTREEKVDYALKKNWRDLWATGFSCRVADLRSRVGKNDVRTFSCEINGGIRRFVPAGLILYVETWSNLQAIGFVPENKVFGKKPPTQDENQSIK